MTGTITRGKVTRADLALWDGRNATVSRVDATGGTVTGLAVGNSVDVLQVYGGGSSRTGGTISAALQAIGSTACTLQFSPGTWTIDSDLTIPATKHSIVPAGCVFEVASTKTLTFAGPVVVEYPTSWTSGSGSVVTSGGIAGGVLSSGAAVTWYVNASTGSDSNAGTSAAPFLTLNKALQSVAPLIRLGQQQTILLADGTYSASYLAASSMTRPAIGYVTGIYAGDRSDDDSGLSGSLVIRGTSKAGTILQTGSDFTYGLYCSQIPNVAVETLTIKTDGVNLAAALLTAHRNCYVQARDVVLDGDSNCTNGAVAEAGGVLEIVGASEIRDCGTNVVAFDESLIVLSDTTAVSGGSTSALGGRGTIVVNNTASVAGSIASEGLTLVCRGTDSSNRVTVTGSITGYNMRLYGTWADFSGATLDLSNCDVMFNVCSWSDAIILRGGAIRLRGATTSYISPASASDVAAPLTLLGDAQVYKDSTVVINGSASKDCAARGVLTQAVAANSTAVNFQAQTGRHMVTQLTSNGTYTGCTLAADSSDFSLPADDGDLWTILLSGSNSVALVDGSTADFAGGGITLGLGGSQYNSVTMVRRTDGIWHELARSGAN